MTMAQFVRLTLMHLGRGVNEPSSPVLEPPPTLDFQAVGETKVDGLGSDIFTRVFMSMYN